jgi:hypothetical protein
MRAKNASGETELWIKLDNDPVPCGQPTSQDASPAVMTPAAKKTRSVVARVERRLRRINREMEVANARNSKPVGMNPA